VIQKKDNEMNKKLRSATGGQNVLVKPEEYKKKGIEVPKKPPPKKDDKK